MTKLKKALKGQIAVQKQISKAKQAQPVKKKKGTYRYKLQVQETEELLLVGEGNFSFALSLAEGLHRADNMTVTTFDSIEIANEKYHDAGDNARGLEDMEGIVLYKVDATKLSLTPELKSKRFDKIIFNFPHVGAGIKDQDENIRANQHLLLEFFNESQMKLKDNGQVIVTIKTGLPYDKWNIKLLAKSAGLKLSRSFDFHPSDFPGYAHRRTIGYVEILSAGNNQEIIKKSPKTYIFQVCPPEKQAEP
jgi:25S rRNA (uracil2634-N3)-methyltransferase